MRFVVAALVLVLAACSPAADKITELTASNAMIAAPRGISGVTAAYVTLVSPADDRIIAVSSPDARAVEMHEMTMMGEGSGAMMQMRKLDGLDLAANKPVRFAQGGLHIMVFDPKTLAPGATFPIIFQLKSGTTKTIAFSVTAP
jgi:periplasmic copper chaperone A